MANDSAAPIDFTIPTVIEDDLKAFHARHFPGAPEPTELFTSDAEVEYEQDDGLGYYPDGVKRTLTDDQVAMFRHSEIQALLRERRLRRELSEQDEPSEENAELSSNRAGTSSAPVHHQQSPAGDQNSGHAKRKWENFIDDSETNPEHLTHRRMARELDELQQESVELAYGEETPAISVQKQLIDVDIDAPIHLKRPTFQWPALGESTLASSGG